LRKPNVLDGPRVASLASFPLRGKSLVIGRSLATVYACVMSAQLSIAEILKHHVSLSVESYDRVYLNGYLSGLQTSGGLVRFLAEQRNSPVPSPVVLRRMSQAYSQEVEQFVEEHSIPLIPFERGQRKDDLANKLRAKDPRRDCVVFVGTAQEKQTGFKGRCEKRSDVTLFHYSRQSVCVKHYYYYIDDEDFGPLFIKVGSYFPYPVKVCLNGHEWAKRQLDKEGIQYESLDNGFLSCADPVRLQKICASLGPAQIEAMFHKWICRIPWHMNEEDRAAGYIHQLSVWQMEVSRTDVFDRPLRGREFFEAVIRENLDLGRPNRVQLLFNRRLRKDTPSRFRTRVITDGVAPNLHIEYKKTGIKQYFKENRALRTETTINDPLDFKIKKGLKNLPALAAIARQTNLRVLETERVSQDCVMSPHSVQRLTQPSIQEDGQRVPGLKLTDPRVAALLAALCLFLHLPAGFRNRQLRPHVADLLGMDRDKYSAAKMSYDLRRLRMKGIVCRVPGSTRWTLTPYGLRVSLFVSRLHARVLRTGFASANTQEITPVTHPLRAALDQVETELNTILDQARRLPRAKAA